jgi:hypothetical protein
LESSAAEGKTGALSTEGSGSRQMQCMARGEFTDKRYLVSDDFLEETRAFF